MSDQASGNVSNSERRSNRRRSLFSRITDTITSFIPSLFESRQSGPLRQLEAEDEPVRPTKRPRTSGTPVSVESPHINRLSVSRVGTVNLPSVTLALPMNIEVDLDAKEDGSDLSVSTSGVSSLLPSISRNGQYLVQPSPADYRTDYISQRNDTTIRKRQSTELWTESASKRMRQDDQQSSASQQSLFISPFYHGRVSYGGAASVRPANQKRSIFDNVTPMKFIIENEDEERPKPQPGFLSNAAQSILQSLERHSSTIASNDRIPLPRSNPFSSLTTPLTRNTVRYQPYLSTYNRYKDVSQSVNSHVENGTETVDASKSDTSSVTPRTFIFNVSNSTSQPIPSTSYDKLSNPSTSQPTSSTSYAQASASNSHLESAKIDTNNRKFPTFSFPLPVTSISQAKLPVSAVDSQPTPSISYTASNSHPESAKTVMDNQKLPTFDFSAKPPQPIPSSSYTRLPSVNTLIIPSTSYAQVPTSNSHAESPKTAKDDQTFPTFDFSSKTSQSIPSTSYAKHPGASILKSSKESVESPQNHSTETPSVRFASKSQYLEKSTPNNGSNPVFIFSNPICINKSEENVIIQPDLAEKPIFTFSKPEYTFKKAASVEKSTFLPTLISPTKAANTPSLAKIVVLPTDLWRCESCMMENSDKDSVCRSCRMPNLAPRMVPKQPTNAEKSISLSSSGWECPTCMVKNKDETVKCVCCQTAKSNVLKSSQSAPTFNFVSAPSTGSSEPDSQQWECPACMVKNKAEVLKCVCCQTANPNGSKVGQSAPAFTFDSLSSKSSTEANLKGQDMPVFTFGSVTSKKTTEANSKGGQSGSTFSFGAIPSKSSIDDNSQQWECPTCMVPNKSEAVKCVCCQTAKPNHLKENASGVSLNFGSLQSTNSTGTKSQQWECPTCMVPNKSEAVKCVCCQTAKPNDSKEKQCAPALIFGPLPPKN
ncbi:unnamed protein product [Hymenolepis diminuta]|uniref:Nuclear pore complex protein Nup153 n=1 Tax=Hymenolepis diminuta TaxID=6216 RepID=A0A564Y6G4_HYMDI|nr:unnamed protein product [Hymenolepis diminuta]